MSAASLTNIHQTKGDRWTMEVLNDTQTFHNIKSSSDYICQRNTLKQVGKVLQTLLSHPDDTSSNHFISSFQGTINIVERNFDGDKVNGIFDESSSLGYTLLHVISDDVVAELCRERSAECLKDCFKIIVSCLDKKAEVGLNQHFVVNFYKDLCFVLAERFGVLKQSVLDNLNHDDCRHQISLLKSRLDDGKNNSTQYEKSEEIRLLLIQMVKNVLNVIHEVVLLHKKSTDSHKGEMIKALNLPSSLLCEVLSKSALLDSYPELKRESCNLLKVLVKVAPSAVKMNEESLLSSLLGSIDTDKNIGRAKECLIRHRHAKTRSLGLETVAEIMIRHGGYCKISKKNLKENEEVKNVQSGVTTWEDSGNFSTFCQVLGTQVIPKIETSLPFDHSASVRSALVAAVGKILHQVTESYAFSNFSSTNNLIHQIHAKLIVLLLIGISDEVDVVKQKSQTLLRECAKAFHCTQGTNLDNDIDILPTTYIRTFMNEIFTIVLHRISNQTSNQSSRRYFEALATAIQVVSLGRDDQQQGLWTDSLLTGMVTTTCHTLLEDGGEESLFEAAFACAKSLGSVREARKSILRIIAVPLHGSHDSTVNVEEHNTDFDVQSSSFKCQLLFSSPDQLSALVNLIGGIVQGWLQYEGREMGTVDELSDINELRTIGKFLASTKVVESVHLSHNAAFALLSSCHTLTNFINFKLLNHALKLHETDEVVFTLIWCSINLIACPKHYNVAEGALDLLERMYANLSESKSFTELIHLNFEAILSKLLHESKVTHWSRGDQTLNTFDALVRSSDGSTIVAHLDKILPIFEIHLTQDVTNDKSRRDKEKLVANFSTRIFFMALIESIVTKPSLPKDEFFPFVQRVLDHVVIPNMVWQVGGMASALRKVSAAVLFSILQGNCVTDQIVFNVAPRLIPLIKSNLTDDDSSLRELSISTMSLLLEKLPNRLGEEAVQDLYPDLMKCLDDSCNSVRFEACETLLHFFKCSIKSNFHGTMLLYITENLFIHLDDPNPAFKEKIFHVLVALLNIDKRYVIKGAQAGLLSHSSTSHCDLLLQYAKQK